LQYRKFGRLNWKVSALGFGAMRLPVIDGDTSRIDETAAISMIRYAIDHGVNYIDTAYPYHGGKSEALVGKALKGGYRERVKLATKMPIWLVNSQSDMTKFLDEQLVRLQTNKIDFYLLHNCKSDRWPKMKDLKVTQWAERAILEGKIGHIGFSFHDQYELLKQIIDEYSGWALCQIMYNYMDTENQAGTKGLEYAASKGLAVVVMEPIAGGMLAVSSKDLQAIWNTAEEKRTPAEWALQWVWNHPEVSVALSGMSTMDQVMENVGSADRSGPNKFTKEELELISKVKRAYLEYGFIACKGCRYCLPCKQNVAIPEIFNLYNELSRNRGYVDGLNAVKAKYTKTITAENGAKRCIRCGECEEKCPQKLEIRNLLQQAALTFEGNR